MRFVRLQRSVAVFTIVCAIWCLGCGGGNENATDFSKLPPADPSVMLPETTGPGSGPAKAAAKPAAK